ncbi:unnamed protein product [Cylindrotheca closterium]|uniref:Uncharacterized protein n=1 Tax=Cylindrotheca closterium TaxID=2856 RepID=A0AAD2PWZ8_9STRA|nr:unnamed protein product [Cylindrotheca closterium]
MTEESSKQKKEPVAAADNQIPSTIPDLNKTTTHTKQGKSIDESPDENSDENHGFLSFELRDPVTPNCCLASSCNDQVQESNLKHQAKVFVARWSFYAKNFVLREKCTLAPNSVATALVGNSTRNSYFQRRIALLSPHPSCDGQDLGRQRICIQEDPLAL